VDTPQRRKKGLGLITRAALEEGSVLRAMAASAPPAVRFVSAEDRDASLAAVLADHQQGADVWLFAYGSLMWNPAVRFVDASVGQLHGWHRRFCLWMLMARGSPEHPGLMLALENGGTCRGLVFRIAAKNAKSELSLVWRREMLTGAYHARWANVATKAGPVRAITFVVNRRHPRYAGRLSDAKAALHIASARGMLGSCAEYFEQTRKKLHTLGLRDAGLERIAAQIELAGSLAVAR
jgi:cation transport protein ChaC